MDPQNPVGHRTLCSDLVNWHAEGYMISGWKTNCSQKKITTLALEHLTDPQASERTPQINYRCEVSGRGATSEQAATPGARGIYDEAGHLVGIEVGRPSTGRWSQRPFPMKLMTRRIDPRDQRAKTFGDISRLYKHLFGACDTALRRYWDGLAPADPHYEIQPLCGN